MNNMTVGQYTSTIHSAQTLTMISSGASPKNSSRQYSAPCPLNQLVQCIQRFFYRGSGIKAVHVIDIDTICSQTFEAVFTTSVFPHALKNSLPPPKVAVPKLNTGTLKPE